TALIVPLHVVVGRAGDGGDEELVGGFDGGLPVGGDDHDGREGGLHRFDAGGAELDGELAGREAGEDLSVGVVEDEPSGAGGVGGGPSNRGDHQMAVHRLIVVAVVGDGEALAEEPV